MAEPATAGYDITRYEVRRFYSALGLAPDEVRELHVQGNRAVATLTTGRIVSVRITETRKK